MDHMKYNHLLLIISVLFESVSTQNNNSSSGNERSQIAFCTCTEVYAKGHSAEGVMES